MGFSGGLWPLRGWQTFYEYVWKKKLKILKMLKISKS